VGRASPRFTVSGNALGVWQSASHVAANPQYLEEARPRRTPRRILRWLGKLLLWTAGFVLIGLVLVLVAGLVAYSHRERLVNEALARFVEPFEVSVGRIDLSTPRRARIEDLRLSPRGVSLDKPLLTVPTVEILYGFNELRLNRRMRSVTFFAPRLVLTDEALAALARGRAGDPEGVDAGAAGPDLAAYYLFTEALTVHDGVFVLEMPGLPRIETRWDLAAPPLLFGEESDAPSEPLAFILREISLGEGGAAAHLGRLSGSLRLARDLSRFDFERLHLEGGAFAVAPDWFARRDEPGAGAEQADAPESGQAEGQAEGQALPEDAEGPEAGERGAGEASDPVEWRVGELVVGSSSVSVEGFDGREGGARFPDLGFDTALRLEELRFAGGRWSSGGPVALVLENVAVGSLQDPLGGAERLTIQAADLGELVHGRRFETVRLEGVDLYLSDATLRRCRPLPDSSDGAEAEGEPDEPADEATPDTPPWTIASLEIEEAAFLMQGASFGGKAAPRLETRLSAELRDLRIGGGKGFDSEGVQNLSLSQARLHAPGSSGVGEPLLGVRAASLGGEWRSFAEARRLGHLHLEGLAVRFSDEALGSWLAWGAPPDPTEAEEEPLALEESPAPAPDADSVYRVADLEVRDGVLLADSSFAAQRVPKIESRFRLATVALDPEGEPLYQLVFEDFRLNNHAVPLDDEGAGLRSEVPDDAPFPSAPFSAGRNPVAEEEVISIESIEMLATATQLQRDRRVQRVRLSGALLNVGEGLRSLVETSAGEADDLQPEAEIEPADPSPEAAAAPAAEPTTLAAPLVPGALGSRPAIPAWTLEEVEITRSRVRFEALLPQIEGLEFNIETTLTEIPLSPEAILSQDAKQKVELAGIEIKDPYNSFITVAELPTIFVEFSLAGLARQEIDRIDLISPSLYVGQGLFWWVDYQRNFRAQNEGASVGLVEDRPAEVQADPDWVIRTISATAGKIVVAPTGIPIGVVPFPFNATTNMEDGRIDLLLNIPDEDYVYTFPEYKIELHGLTGNIEFNVPIDQLSNNLVQTFTLDRIRWKDYEASQLYLTVTFDADGIYGALGGEAYDGYAEGQFNVYLDDPGKWDGWIAGTDLDTGPVTQILAPDNFLMEGKVSLNLVSEGRRTELGDTSGDFRTTTPGWFDVTKLGGILDELPEGWSSLQRSLTELSLIALKRFDYDRGAGSLSLSGQEGRLQFHFAGPYGTRGLNLQLHDRRHTNTLSSSENSAGPMPEASARPAAP